MKKLLFFITFTVFLCLSCSSDKITMTAELSRQIQEDQRISQVEKMAEDLVRNGFQAGDSYAEVWIRDLNSFVELSCHVSDKDKLRDALITFFKFQGEDGNIPDGYAPRDKAYSSYNFISSKYDTILVAHKNTVETDQESSMVQAIYKYIQATGDTSLLDEKIGDRNIEQRMSDAMHYLLNDRLDPKRGLIWGATTADWGDVQPEHEWGVELDSLSHLSIDIYDNAMFIIAMNNLAEMVRDKKEIDFWTAKSKEISTNAKKYLWDNNQKKFIPHIYLAGSPFPADFDENKIHYHGGTTMAIEAGLLSKDEVEIIYNQMQQNVKDAKAQSIGLTVYPAYPIGYFKNSWMAQEYYYQNGGDWTWFGGRTIQQFIKYGMYDEAYTSISPMLDLVIKNNGFYEWWSPSGDPLGASNFRGAAGVLWKSIQMFKEHSPDNLKK